MASYRLDQRGNYVRIVRDASGKIVENNRLNNVNQRHLRLDIGCFGQILNSLIDAGVKVKPVLRRIARKSATPITNAAKLLAPSKRKKVIYSGPTITRTINAKGKSKTYESGSKVFSYGTTGQLKKSIGSRVFTDRLGVVRALVGPRRKAWTYAFKKYHKPSRNHPAVKNAMVRVYPIFYSHLVEHGFTAKLWRSGKLRPVAAHPFLQPAMDRTRSTVLKITKDELDYEMQKAFAGVAA